MRLLPIFCAVAWLLGPLSAQAATADARADKTAEELRPGTTFKDCADCPEMVTIPAGSFEMGPSGITGSGQPAHRVQFAGSFALGRTEVTQAQWQLIMGSNPSRFSNCGDDCPVENVSWDDALEFVRRMNQKTGKNYRLPSEAEWEYACRAGERHDYCGSDQIERVAWYESNSGGKTHPVAGKQANAWGLYDMSGNVWEWTGDCWNDDYNGAPTDGSAWTAGKCSAGRVVRGGSWFNGPQDKRVAKRTGEFTSIRVINSGVRLARTLP